MSREIDLDRRRFLGAAVMTMAAAEIVTIGSAEARSGRIDPADPTKNKKGTIASFGPIKQIDAGVLNVGYAEAGPADGPAVSAIDR
jgi:hypothetical protein